MPTRDAATIRATVKGLDGIEALRRALAMAEALQDSGFTVTLSGDVFVDARLSADHAPVPWSRHDPSDPVEVDHADA